MKATLLAVALALGQISSLNTMQSKPVARMATNAYTIDASNGGKQLQLINTLAELGLPNDPPLIDSQGQPWLVDIKNLGPHLVTVTGKAGFRVEVPVGQTIHVASNGSSYSLKR